MNNDEVKEQLEETIRIYKNGPRCGFCHGLKNKARNLPFVIMKKLGASEEEVYELRKLQCFCHKLMS